MTKETRNPNVGRIRHAPLSNFALRHSSFFRHSDFVIRHWLLILALATLNGSLLAHDSPEHEAELLTLRMARTGKTAPLLIRRAAEYKAIGELSKAAADLNEAIALEPKLIAAHADLSRVLFAQEKLADACDSVTRALGLTRDAAEGAPLYLLRAQIQAARGHAAEALADCELSARRDDQDWYLIRSQMQGQLGKLDARVTGLKEGFDRNSSIVLEIEWIEAMIDAGQYGPALDRIEEHLNHLRWRSSWLLRRARALKGMKADFRPDTIAALSELNQRIRPERPEPTLLLDRAMAFALLGKTTEAANDLVLAKKRGLPPSACVRVEALLKSGGLGSKQP